LLRWPRNCCTSRIFAFDWGYFSLTQSFLESSENITVSRILPKTRFFRPHFCRRQHGSNLNYVTGPDAMEFCEITQNTDHYAVPSHSRSPFFSSGDCESRGRHSTVSAEASSSRPNAQVRERCLCKWCAATVIATMRVLCL